MAEIKKSALPGGDPLSSGCCDDEETRISRPSASLTRRRTKEPAAKTDTSPPAGLCGHPIYEVLEPLGCGGMGVVYKARHRVMDRLVALKVVRPGLVDNPSMAARFRREIRAAAQLNHPNITHAYDAGEAGGAHYLVMEYVEGANLDAVISGCGWLPPARACDYARQTALGLQHAHERGMVHRDVKPHNLMLTPRGQVKILDFGLSRFVSETVPVEAKGRSRSVRVTPSDAGLGTVDYLAPEEAIDARSADIRADIYSLGCTLYRMLAGRVPFPEGSFADKLRRHASKRPEALAVLQPDLPSGLSDIVDRMLAKRPDRRPQTPAEVADVLAPFAAPAARHVMIVEDNAAARQSMAAILEREGYAVSGAANGREALDRLLEGAKPGLILLDLKMPVMDGAEFLQALRSAPGLAELPVVIVSAADQTQAERLDAAAFLPKPVEAQELTDAVHRHAVAE